MRFGQKISQKILTNFLGLSYRLIYFNNFFDENTNHFAKKLQKSNTAAKKAELNARTYYNSEY